MTYASRDYAAKGATMVYDHARHLRYDMTVRGCPLCEQLIALKAKRRQHAGRAHYLQQATYETHRTEARND